MAHYQGYIYVPHGSYQECRDNTLGNGYDVDYFASEQCYDFCSLLYYQYGLRLITKAGGGGAQDCWIYSRQVNSQTPFISVFRVQDIKRGDIVVFGGGKWGHIAFADQDYSQRTYNFGKQRYEINCLGQNQVGNGSGYPVTVTPIGLDGFLGIFRNTYWQGDTPEPEPESGYNKHRYNFVLFNRRKRQEKWTKKPLKQK